MSVVLSEHTFHSTIGAYVRPWYLWIFRYSQAAEVHLIAIVSALGVQTAKTSFVPHVFRQDGRLTHLHRSFGLVYHG